MLDNLIAQMENGFTVDSGELRRAITRTSQESLATIIHSLKSKIDEGKLNSDSLVRTASLIRQITKEFGGDTDAVSNTELSRFKGCLRLV